jgi:hypothetical protein
MVARSPLCKIPLLHALGILPAVCHGEAAWLWVGGGRFTYLRSMLWFGMARIAYSPAMTAAGAPGHSWRFVLGRKTNLISLASMCNRIWELATVGTTSVVRTTAAWRRDGKKERMTRATRLGREFSTGELSYRSSSKPWLGGSKSSSPDGT